jgi:hypothetical protein
MNLQLVSMKTPVSFWEFVKAHGDGEGLRREEGSNPTRLTRLRLEPAANASPSGSRPTTPKTLPTGTSASLQFVSKFRDGATTSFRNIENAHLTG